MYETTALLVYETGSLTSMMYLLMSLIGATMLLFLVYWFWSWGK